MNKIKYLKTIQWILWSFIYTLYFGFLSIQSLLTKIVLHGDMAMYLSAATVSNGTQFMKLIKWFLRRILKTFTIWALSYAKLCLSLVDFLDLPSAKIQNWLIDWLLLNIQRAVFQLYSGPSWSIYIDSPSVARGLRYFSTQES